MRVASDVQECADGESMAVVPSHVRDPGLARVRGDQQSIPLVCAIGSWGRKPILELRSY
jgi:hypothetical protein